VLYIPSILPFGFISIMTFLLYKKSGKDLGRVWGSTVQQMKKPTQALLGALVFVNLMMMGGDQSAVALMGDHLAGLTGDSWTYFASLLGALGSFFSGSATISNLSFGGIQDAIATQLQLDRTSLLAIQSVGGAMGNMVCINNIVAVASVLALGNMEGYILKRTVRILLVYATVVALMAFLLP
jgi:lactate permease